jgi:GNAT superfamily N-acetyltransferase
VNRVRVTARDFWCLLRQVSPKAALAYLWEIVRSQLYLATDEVIVRKQFAAEPPTTTGAIRLEDAQAHHLPLLAEFNQRQCNTARTHRFATGLAEGRRALLGFRDDDLIGYFWWHDARQAAEGFYLSRFGVRLADDEMYGYDLFVAPEHRGSGTPIEFLAAIEAELVRLGYRAMYGFVDARNVAGRWLWASSGYGDVMRGRTRRVLRRLMLVEGRGWLVNGRQGMRPLTRSRC